MRTKTAKMIVAFIVMMVIAATNIFAQPPMPPMPPGMDDSGGLSGGGFGHHANSLTGAPGLPGIPGPSDLPPSPQPVLNYEIVDLTPDIGSQVSAAGGINDSGETVGSIGGPSGSGGLSTVPNGPMVSGIGTSIFCRSINNHGQIVGNYGSTSGSGYAFLYENGILKNINNLVTSGLSTGYTLAVAMGISDDGEIVGFGFDPSHHTFAFLYKNGIATMLAGASSEATGINSSGTISGGNGYPFLYDNGSLLNLNVSSLNGIIATGVNDAKQAVGYGMKSSGNMFAFLYYGSSMIELGTLGGNNSQALGINSSGLIIGNSDVNSTTSDPFIYINGTMLDLVSLIVNNAGWTGQQVIAINGAGQIVGNGYNPLGQYHAFRLDPILPCPTWTIHGNGFHQGDSAPAVPTYYGNPGAGTALGKFDSEGRAKTSTYGCVLCSVATMLTSIQGLESITPAILNTYLTDPAISGQGYDKADMNWTEIGKLPSLQTYSISFVSSPSITDQETLNAYLEDHVCGQEDRVIIEFYTDSQKDTHYVLVTGRDGNDWKVFDPGWIHSFDRITGMPNDNLLSSLAAHLAGFKTSSTSSSGGLVSWTFSIAGVRTYKIGAVSSANFTGTVHSPVEILVTDPNGKRVGYDPTTSSDIFEIANASYIRDYPLADCDENILSIGDTNGIKTFCIPSPIGGNYKVQLTGTSFGGYTFDTQTYWGISNGQPLQTMTGTASPGVIITNQFFVKAASIITSHSIVSNMFSLSFTTQTNVTYSLESQNAPNGTNWNTLQTMVATNAITTVNQPVTNGTMFFRVVAH